jgi:hypothetical protein
MRRNNGTEYRRQCMETATFTTGTEKFSFAFALFLFSCISKQYCKRHFCECSKCVWSTTRLNKNFENCCFWNNWFGRRVSDDMRSSVIVMRMCSMKPCGVVHIFNSIRNILLWVVCSSSCVMIHVWLVMFSPRRVKCSSLSICWRSSICLSSALRTILANACRLCLDVVSQTKYA